MADNGIGNIEEQEPASDPGLDLGWLPLAQGELVLLELWRLRREMLSDPAAQKIQVGQGQPVEQTIRGDRRDTYNGVVIYNPTPATLSIGFEAGTGWLAPATVPPYTWASFPERYANLSVATLNPADQQQTITQPVTILRTRVPPVAAAGPFGASQPISSLQAAQAVGAGAVLDNGAPRQAHSLVVTSSPGVTAGGVTLQGSHDGTNFANLAAALNINAANAVFTSFPAAPAAFRYVRAALTTAITGGTVNATVASS